MFVAFGSTITSLVTSNIVVPYNNRNATTSRLVVPNRICVCMYIYLC